VSPAVTRAQVDPPNGIDGTWNATEVVNSDRWLVISDR